MSSSFGTRPSLPMVALSPSEPTGATHCGTATPIASLNMVTLRETSGDPASPADAHSKIAHIRPVHRQNRSGPGFLREKHLLLFPVFQPPLSHRR